jgi:inositol-pentakisphosphate 2-kinase
MADVRHTNPSSWKYVSEGGATIVFSYVGPPHPKFDGTVLRLRKITANTATRPHAQSDSESERDDPTIEFQSKCIERLIPPQYLPRLESVVIDRSWLEALVALHDSVRPEERREKGGINLERKSGVLATDLVGGNWLAVEIKVSLLAFCCNWLFFKSLLNLNPKKKKILVTLKAKMGILAISRASIRSNEIDETSDLSILHAFTPEIS